MCSSVLQVDSRHSWWINEEHPSVRNGTLVLVVWMLQVLLEELDVSSASLCSPNRAWIACHLWTFGVQVGTMRFAGLLSNSSRSVNNSWCRFSLSNQVMSHTVWVRNRPLKGSYILQVMPCRCFDDSSVLCSNMYIASFVQSDWWNSRYTWQGIKTEEIW